MILPEPTPGTSTAIPLFFTIVNAVSLVVASVALIWLCRVFIESDRRPGDRK